jgi:hypothetical protein
MKIISRNQVYILLKLAQNDEERDETQNLVWPILKKDPRMSTTSKGYLKVPFFVQSKIREMIEL